MSYTKDGGVIPNGVPVSQKKGVEEAYQQFGLVRGYIEKVVYPGDSENITGDLEYEVNIGGMVYVGVNDASLGGGILNSHTKIRRGFSSPLDNPFSKTFHEKRDGDCVWCLFINGCLDTPLIIASAKHPRVTDNPDYKVPSKGDGVFERYEEDGFEFLVNEDSYSIKYIGQKKIFGPPGASSKVTRDPTTQDAIGTEIKINKNGQIDVKCKGLSGNVNVEGAQNVTCKGVAGSFQAEGSGGKMKLASGKAAIGNVSGELLDLCDQHLQQAINIATQLQVETHMGNLGYPTGIPDNAAAYSGIQTALTTIKTTLGLIKGSL